MTISVLSIEVYIIIILYSTIFSWVKFFVDFMALKKKTIHENKGIYMVHTNYLQNHENFGPRKIGLRPGDKANITLLSTFNFCPNVTSMLVSSTQCNCMFI